MKGLIAVATFFLVTGFLVPMAAANGDAPEPYPLDYWALRSVINNAQVSPDGKYLGVMKIPSKKAKMVASPMVKMVSTS